MKKKILMVVGTVIGIVLSLMTVIVISAYIMVQQGYGITVGRYLDSSGGAMLIDDNSPITMSAKNGKQQMFDGLTTGDKIFVIHGLIMESYPAQTYVKYCFKMEDGNWSNFSIEVLQDLYGMGWISEEDINHYYADIEKE